MNQHLPALATALLALTTALLALGDGARADDGGLRDPMRSPIAARTGAASEAQAAPVIKPVARHLMVVGGHRYVIEGGQRRGVGDMLGGARIEKIEDSAVLVRSGNVLQRLPLFAGVIKKPVIEPVASAASAPLAIRTARAPAPPNAPPQR